MNTLSKVLVFLVFFSPASYSMNKAELIDAMASESGLSKADAKRALDGFIDNTSKALKKGDKVALVGFGTFSSTRAKQNITFDFNLDSARIPQVISTYLTYYWLDGVDHLGNELNILHESLNKKDADRAYIGTHASMVSFYAQWIDLIVAAGLDGGETVVKHWHSINEMFAKDFNVDHVHREYMDKYFVSSTKALSNIGSSGEDGVAAPDNEDIIRAIVKNTGLSPEQARAGVDSFFDITYRAMNSGDQVRLGEFGSFSVTRKPMAKGRNPQTGKEIKIAAKKVVKFKAGADLSKKVN